jgi:hypothetical protein
MTGYPSSSRVAICMLSLLCNKLLTSVSVTGFGMPGRVYMTFNVPVTPTVDIKIETKRHMSPY